MYCTVCEQAAIHLVLCILSLLSASYPVACDMILDREGIHSEAWTNQRVYLYEGICFCFPFSVRVELKEINIAKGHLFHLYLLGHLSSS